MSLSVIMPVVFFIMSFHESFLTFHEVHDSGIFHHTTEISHWKENWGMGAFKLLQCGATLVLSAMKSKRRYIKYIGGELEARDVWDVEGPSLETANWAKRAKPRAEFPGAHSISADLFRHYFIYTPASFHTAFWSDLLIPSPLTLSNERSSR